VLTQAWLATSLHGFSARRRDMIGAISLQQVESDSQECYLCAAAMAAP